MGNTLGDETMIQKQVSPAETGLTLNSAGQAIAPSQYMTVAT
jgi:hypothetical protein